MSDRASSDAVEQSSSSVSFDRCGENRLSITTRYTAYFGDSLFTVGIACNTPLPVAPAVFP